ncbi:MAG TPA: sulfite exporter TauE/SafE family protein, partial [Baekduia sp.]|nr:sulfite exporter TauE/SafE family protein [Baekduia sp.]
MDPLVIAFGLGVGILVGLTGIGGGSLMTPLLILFAGVPPTVAIGTDLAYGAVTKTVGGWQHLRKGTVDLGVSKWLAFGSVPGSLVGVWLLERFGDDLQDQLLWAVAGALLVVSLSILFRALFLRAAIDRERHTVELTPHVKAGATSIGAVLGLILGVTSVGSGALIGLALILVFRLTPHRVVGTDVFHAAILLWSAGLAHWVGGNVDFMLMGTILLGSLPGVVVGTHLIDKVPANALRPALGCVLL